MTEATQSTPELLSVAQADRDAAEAFLKGDGEWHSGMPEYGRVERIALGLADDDPLVQLCVSIRIEHSTPDRNAVLELLREARPLVAAMEMEGDLDIFDLLARIDTALTTAEPKP